MDALIVIFVLYCLVAMVTFWVMFGRFVGRQDLRGRGILGEVDPSDGLLAFVFMIFVAFFVLAVANPVRFAHLVFEAAFWPVTAWYRLRGRGVDAEADTEPDDERLDVAFFEEVLRREGFPGTPHNVFALQERLGIMFTVKAKQFMEATGDIDDWNAFVARAGYPRTADEMPSWPQRVLDALVAWDADIAPHLDDFPEKYVGILLEGKGTGSGFFGGPVDEPLPTATLEWAMKGLGQPDAVPVAPPVAAPAPLPVAPLVPAPREPATPAPGRTPVPAPPASSFDEPRTAPIRLPRAPVPTRARSVRAMAVMSVPTAPPAAVAVPESRSFPRHAAPTSPVGAVVAAGSPVASPRAGRHARP